MTYKISYPKSLSSPYEYTNVLNNRVYITSDILKNELSKLFKDIVLLPRNKYILEDDENKYEIILNFESNHVIGEIFNSFSEDNNKDAKKLIKHDETCYPKYENNYYFLCNSFEEANCVAKIFDDNIIQDRRLKITQHQNFEFVITENYQNVLERIDVFFSPETIVFYDQLGLTHRRGILLYGRPGTGKSSFAKEIIRRHNEAIVFRSFGRVIDNEKKKKIIFLDEIEGLLENGSETRTSLLIAIEEIPANTLLLATTNKPEKFDTAFFNRPGRFDDVLCCDYPTYKDREMFLKSKRMDCMEVLPFTEGLTFAHINELVYRVKMNKEDPETAYKLMKELNKKEEILNDEKRASRMGFGRYVEEEED